MKSFLASERRADWFGKMLTPTQYRLKEGQKFFSGKKGFIWKKVGKIKILILYGFNIIIII